MIQINDLGTSETEHLPKTLIYHGQNQKANIADIIMTVTMTMKKKQDTKLTLKTGRDFSVMLLTKNELISVALVSSTTAEADL